MFGISPMMMAMLRALAHHKYLTVSHLLALGAINSKDVARRYFSTMKKEKLVNRQVHQSIGESVKKKGFLSYHRQEYLRYLTRAGVCFLLQNTNLTEQQIRHPKKPEKRLKNDYFHRVSTVFTHISFEKRVEAQGGTIDKFLVYYDNNKRRKGRRFEAETRIELNEKQHFTPDVICSYTNAQKQPFVFCLEVYNGNKIGYVMQQLEKLFGILDSSKKVENKVTVQAVPRILVTLDNEALQSKLLERLPKVAAFHVHEVEELIFFKQDVEVWEDFGTNRVNIEGEEIDLADLQPFEIKKDTLNQN